MMTEENLIADLDGMADAARRMSAAARELQETDLSPREIRKIKTAYVMVQSILSDLEAMDDEIVLGSEYLDRGEQREMQTTNDPYEKLKDEALENLLKITRESRPKMLYLLEQWEKLDRKTRNERINHYFRTDEMKGYITTAGSRHFTPRYELPSRVEKRNGGWEVFVPSVLPPPIDARLVPGIPPRLRTTAGQVIEEMDNYVGGCGALRTQALARRNLLALARRQKELMEAEISRLEAEISRLEAEA
jgi:hypothetical protein